jgi:hypothetical protein
MYFFLLYHCIEMSDVIFAGLYINKCWLKKVSTWCFILVVKSRQELRIGADDDSSERVLVLQCPNFRWGGATL